MKDEEIINLYWDRDEQAIPATHEKYGSWCQGIAHRILHNPSDAEECLSDTYLSAWNHIPPQRPEIFRAWLGKITRNLALSRYRSLTAEKRGGTETALALEELEYCVSGSKSPEEALDADELSALIGRFLDGLPEDQRRIFLRRYWYLESIRSIAQENHTSESRIASMLFRHRKQLRGTLEKEGYFV